MRQIKHTCCAAIILWIITDLCHDFGVLSYGQTAVIQQERFWQQRAAEQEVMGRFDKAIEYYQQLLSVKPHDMAVYLAAKRCFLQNKDYQGWRHLILELQKRHRDIQYEVDLAEIACLQGKKNEAVQKWNAVVDDNPMNERAYLLVGAVLVEYRFFSEAAAVYIRGRKHFKEDNKFTFELVRIYDLQSDLTQLTKEYLSFLDKNPGQIHFVQGQLLNASRSQEAAEKIITVVKAKQKSDKTFLAYGHRLLGALYTQGKNYKNALQHYLALEGLLSKTQQDELGIFLYSYGMAAMNDGAHEEARQAFELVVLQDGINTVHKARGEYALAQLFEKEHKYGLAIAAYENFIQKYVKYDEQLSALFRIAELYFQQLFDISQAEATYERILTSPNASSYHVMSARQKLSECAIARGDHQTARQYLLGIIAVTPPENSTHRQAALKVSYLDILEGQPKQAITRIERLLKQQEPGRAPMADVMENDLLDLYIFLKDNEKDSLGIDRFGKVQFLQWQNAYATAIDSIRIFLQRFPATKVKNRLQRMEIESLRHLNRSDEALQVCREYLLHPAANEQERALKTVVEIYDQDLYDHKKTLEYAELFLEKFPDSIYIEQIRQKIRALEHHGDVSN